MTADNDHSGLKPAAEVSALHLDTLDKDLKVVDGAIVIENRAEKEKKLLRRIDLRMMPLMMLICKLPTPCVLFTMEYD